MSTESIIYDIKKEYKRIDSKWLRLHFKTSIVLVLFSFIVECIIGLVLYDMGEIYISISKYILKYLLVPTLLNLTFVVIGYITINIKCLKQSVKVYIISLLFVAICFVLSSVHAIFASIYLIFTIPILFTIIYCDYLLITFTFLCSICAKFVSELLITWDPDKLNILDNNIGLANSFVSLFILCAFYGVSMIVIRFEREKNNASIQKELERHQLERKLEKDELTAINNRTALKNAFENMEEDTSGNIYVFVMMDIDNFKMLNDTLGHHKGDLFLVELGNILKLNCVNAIPFRFGGDEFCILFKNQDLKDIIETCKKIQNDFKKFVHQNEVNISLTLSFGIANYSQGMTATQLLKNADSALYKSKTVKNSIFIYNQEDGYTKRWD